jgi:hypothetical protein
MISSLEIASNSKQYLLPILKRMYLKIVDYIIAEMKFLTIFMQIKTI